MNEFKDKLKNARKEVGLTQKDVAMQLGVVESAYANWEQGRTEPSIDNLKKLSEIFNISLDVLVGSLEKKQLEASSPNDAKYITKDIYLTKSVDWREVSQKSKIKNPSIEDFGKFYIAEEQKYIKKLYGDKFISFNRFEKIYHNCACGAKRAYVSRVYYKLINNEDIDIGSRIIILNCNNCDTITYAYQELID